MARIQTFYKLAKRRYLPNYWSYKVFKEYSCESGTPLFKWSVNKIDYDKQLKLLNFWTSVIIYKSLLSKNIFLCSKLRIFIQKKFNIQYASDYVISELPRNERPKTEN